MRILMIEDGTAGSLSTLLEEADHDVLSLLDFDDASDALELQRFDAVIVPALSRFNQLAVFRTRLREFEKRQGVSSSTPVIAISSSFQCESADECLPEICSAREIENAVVRWNALAAQSQQMAPDRSATPIFEPAAFEEQMCSDTELMLEILDLYVAESSRQRDEMQAALGAHQMRTLSEIAHTIKGSLGSLHAPRARQCAQDLEQAAKQGDYVRSSSNLQDLESELNALEPVLESFKNGL